MADQPRITDYGLATLESDALYNLLPYVVRAVDPGPIRQWAEAMRTGQHNAVVEWLRRFPRQQDPTQAGKFHPSDFGEDPALLREWKALRRSLVPLTDTQLARRLDLERLLPKSLRALAFEEEVLRQLGRLAGERAYAGLPDFALRPLIATAIQRHHLKGSHASLSLLGRILGIFDLKARELWTRFALRAPRDPASPDNEGYFLPQSEAYPYLPVSDVYDGEVLTTKVRGAAGVSRLEEGPNQWPLGNPAYDPFNLQDLTEDAVFSADDIISVTFPYLSLDRRSFRYYLAAINDNNPFINLMGEVEEFLRPGLYQLAGGGPTTTAHAFIPYRSGEGGVRVEALSVGSYGNAVVLIVRSNLNGTQTLIAEGPQSTVKYKSSYFDLIIGVSADSFFTTAPAIPVSRIPDATSRDSFISRVPPDYPLTGTGSGTLVKSDPAIHFCLDMAAFNALATVVREIVESVRPISRRIRRHAAGLVFADQFRFAPGCVRTDVVLEALDGSRWRLQPIGLSTLTWTPTQDAPGQVIQFDYLTGQFVNWRVTSDGSFFTSPANSSVAQDELVFLASTVGSGYAYVSGGILLLSPQHPRATDAIHGDGTPNEAYLTPDLVRVIERPAEEVRPYMSQDANPDDHPEPAACLTFQPVPEDALSARTALTDFSKFHLAAHPGVEDQGAGDGQANWWYDLDGSFHGYDLRLRSAGINHQLIEPVPTGDQGRGDGLSRDYPVRFLPRTGKYAFRDRITGVAMIAQYSRDSPDENTGPTLILDTLSDLDGPMEGVVPEDDWVEPEGLGGALFLEEENRPWQRHYNLSWAILKTFTALTDDSGQAKLTLASPSSVLPLGSLVTVEAGGSQYTGIATVIDSDDTSITLSTSYGSSYSGGGSVWHRSEPILVRGASGFSLTMRASADANPTKSLSWRLWGRTLNGDVRIITSGTLAPSSYHGETITLATDARTPLSEGDVWEYFWLEVQGNLAGSTSLSFLGEPDFDLEGSLCVEGSERDDLQVILVDDGKKWWEYGQGGIESYEPLDGGEKHWRGGMWFTSLTGSYEDRGDGLPALLTFS